MDYGNLPLPASAPGKNTRCFEKEVQGRCNREGANTNKLGCAMTNRKKIVLQSLKILYQFNGFVYVFLLTM